MPLCPVIPASGPLALIRALPPTPFNRNLQVCDCHQLPLVPQELSLNRCHTCALEAARLQEEAEASSPTAAAAAAVGACAPMAAPCCAAARQRSCGHKAAPGRCASIPEEAGEEAEDGDSMWVDAPHQALAGPCPPAEPCRRSVDSSRSDTFAA